MKRRTTLEYRPQGWPYAANEYGYPGLKLCCGHVHPPCEEIPGWRVIRYDRKGRLIGHYCDEHVPEDDLANGEPLAAAPEPPTGTQGAPDD